MKAYFPYQPTIIIALILTALLSFYSDAYSTQQIDVDSVEVELIEGIHKIDIDFEKNILTADKKEVIVEKGPIPSKCLWVERVPLFYDGNLENEIEKELSYPKLPEYLRNKKYKVVITIEIDNNGKQIPDKSYVYRSSGIELLDNEALRVARTLHN